MTNYLLSFDPGKSSGIALLAYDDASVALERSGQVEGGVRGLVSWFNENISHYIDLDLNEPVSWHLPGSGNTTVISEKFTPLSGKGFNQTLDSVEPLRGEGALITLGLMPDYPDPKWRRPDRQYLYGGASLAEKKKRAYAFLKDNDFYVTGRDVGCKDANDARSAILHGISYLVQVEKHKSMFEKISEWTEKISEWTEKIRE